jgi:DNA gyrase inhibitor GyrI
MTQEASPVLRVYLRELPRYNVGYVTRQVDEAAGHFSSSIGAGFQLIKQWAVAQHVALTEHLLIGIPHVAGRKLIAYDCCIQLAPDTPALPPDWRVKQLPAGRYAVLTLDKDSATIGAQIGQFFAEYVPQHQLQVDATRSSYEVYYTQTMDYCVPIV